MKEIDENEEIEVIITPEMENEIDKELFNINLLKDQGRLEGEFKNISNEAYHHQKCPGLSRSTLMIARFSIAKFAAKMKGLLPWKTSPAKEFGTTAHTFVLEPHEYEKE